MTTLPAYTKSYATASDIVEHIRNRGLDVPDLNYAAEKIDQIGYEHLRIYFLSCRDEDNQPDKPFIQGTSFQHILQIYECDEKLRSTLFTAVGQFEIQLRNSISEILNARFGSHPYFNKAAFKNYKSYHEALHSFHKVYIASKDMRAKHYKDSYSTPFLPPIWILKEFLTFGTASRILKDLSTCVLIDVSTRFGLPKQTPRNVIENWVQALVDLRNICAHHDRLFNRTFQKRLRQSNKLNIPAPDIRHDKLRALTQCLDHMMSARRGQSDVEKAVCRILDQYQNIQTAKGPIKKIAGF